MAVLAERLQWGAPSHVLSRLPCTVWWPAGPGMSLGSLEMCATKVSQASVVYPVFNASDSSEL